MKRPNKVYISPFTFKIIWAEDPSESALGETSFTSRKITIYQSPSSELLKETLCHEILHCILEGVMSAVVTMEPDKDNKLDVEECVVELVSPKILQVYRDNPAVRKFIFGS
jgi:hypothetical protein